MRKVLCVLGTRPEAIKMAPVIRTLAAAGGRLRPVVCVTDQHREMLDQVLDFFAIRPDHRLGVMREDQSPAQVAALILERLPAVFTAVGPAVVLVQGDTTTTVAAAMASFYAGIPVAHVEAGLRTYQRRAPFPEEANRQMTTVLTDWHFAPTDWARENLLREGVADDRIRVTGNPIVDALHWTMGKLGSQPSEGLPRVDTRHRMLLVTVHRRESFGAHFATVCRALRDLAERNPDIEIIYPVHLNPRVYKPAHRILAGCPRIHLLPPLDYWHLVDLLQRCYLVLTDSGGIQEEAPSLGKPVLVMRDTTERPEGVLAGAASLVGTSRSRIVAEAERLLNNPTAYARMQGGSNPYGDGRAGERIADHLQAVFTHPRSGYSPKDAAAARRRGKLKLAAVPNVMV